MSGCEHPNQVLIPGHHSEDNVKTYVCSDCLEIIPHDPVFGRCETMQQKIRKLKSRIDILQFNVDETIKEFLEKQEENNDG